MVLPPQVIDKELDKSVGLQRMEIDAYELRAENFRIEYP